MKYIMIDDEHELYTAMMGDLFTQNKYDVIELPRMRIPNFLKKLYNIHYDNRLNKRIKLPLKWIWYPFYELHKYKFDPNEEYCVLFMNGSLRNHYEKQYLLNIKKRYPNVKYAVLIFDSSKYPGAKRAFELLPVFDYKFSFDKSDCEKYGLKYFYNCLSKPDYILNIEKVKSNAFFIGNAYGRLEMLQKVFEIISDHLDNCSFYITGVSLENQKEIKGVIYNHPLSFKDDLIYSYNTDCIIEILREGQTGITLRTCEAILFNKKLLTNNTSLLSMPFYDERYMYVFKTVEDIDINFLLEDVVVEYENNDLFSPVNILDKIEQINKGEI